MGIIRHLHGPGFQIRRTGAGRGKNTLGAEGIYPQKGQGKPLLGGWESGPGWGLKTDGGGGHPQCGGPSDQGHLMLPPEDWPIQKKVAAILSTDNLSAGLLWFQS